MDNLNLQDEQPFKYEVLPSHHLQVQSSQRLGRYLSRLEEEEQSCMELWDNGNGLCVEIEAVDCTTRRLQSDLEEIWSHKREMGKYILQLEVDSN